MNVYVGISLIILFTTTSFALPVKILRIGDSQTAGYCADVTFRDSMASRGIQWIAQGTRKSWAFIDDYNYNEGWGGTSLEWFTSYQTSQDSTIINDYPISRILKQFHPDIICLMLGINNMNVPLDIPYLATKYNALLDSIDRLCQPDIQVILSKITPHIDLTVRERDSIFNEQVVTVMVNNRCAMGKNYHLVDAFSIIDVDSDLQDAVHINGVGRAKLCNLWVNAIADIVHTQRVNTPLLRKSVVQSYIAPSTYDLMGRTMRRGFDIKGVTNLIIVDGRSKLHLIQ